jgi:hypothetical protein
VTAPVGVSLDGGELAVVLPACFSDGADAAIVAPLTGDESDLDEDRWWRSKGYVGDVADGVRVDPRWWESSTGPEPDLERPLSVSVWVGDLDYGTLLYDADLSVMPTLGDDLLVDGEVMTREEFFDTFGGGDC